MSRFSAVTLASLLTISAATTAFAAEPPDGRCEGSKMRAVSRSSATWLQCHARAAAAGMSPKPACIEHAVTALTRVFAAALGRGNCLTESGYDAIRARMESFTTAVPAALDMSAGRDRCASAKLKAVSRRIVLDLDCRKSAVEAGVPADGACLLAAQDDLLAAFENIESRYSCLTTDDAEDIETSIESFLQDVLALIDGTAGGPSPTGLAAVIDGGDIDLTWETPSPHDGLTHARLLRRLNAAPEGPSDPLATELFFGAAEAATDDLTSLLPNTTATPRTYHYAVFACTPAGTCETNGSHTTIAPTVVQALHAGGYTMHWRHASADVCADSTNLGPAATTSSPNWWKTCDSNCATTTARQLNATGRAESVAIGDAFEARGIPVGAVKSSEFCRNFETAALMDFGPVVEETPLLTYFVYDEANRCNDTYTLLAQAPAPGTNTALIGHAGNTCPILSTLAWAEAAIFKPDGIGGSVFIDRVLATQWMMLP